MGSGQTGIVMCQEAVCVHQQASGHVPGTGGPKQQAPSALRQLVFVKIESPETSEQELRKCLLRNSLWADLCATYGSGMAHRIVGGARYLGR